MVADLSSAEATLYLVHWDADEAAELARPGRDQGWQVTIESEDGGRAAKRILENLPTVLVISLARLPSHGRETALFLRSKLDPESLPIIFFGGDAQKAADILRSIPGSSHVPDDGLWRALERYLPSS